MNKKDWLMAAIVLIAAITLSYLLTTGILFLILLAFGQPWFGCKVSFCIWLWLCLLSSISNAYTTRK